MGVFVFSKKEIDDISERVEILESFATALVDDCIELKCKINNCEHPIMKAGD